MIPAHAHLQSHGDLHRLDRRLDDLRGERDLPHQSGAGIAVHDLLDRAAHVDVDDRRPAVLVELRGLGHFMRGAAGQLHRDRILDRIPGRFLKRLAGLADHRLACDHLRHGEPGAVALHDLPERPVGDTRHRRQNHGSFNPDRADGDGRQRLHGKART